MPDTFPARLRLLRTRAGLTAYALAQRAGMHAIAIDRYESGREPRGPAIVALAKALDCTAGQLLGLEPLDSDTTVS